MRILIDGFFLDKPRGMGKYLKELLYSLSLYELEEIQIDICIPKNMSNEELIIHSKFNYIRYKKLPFPLWEQVLLPIISSKHIYDIVHCPYNTKPLLFNLGYQKHLVTIHDLIYMNKNGHTPYQVLGNLYRKYIVLSYREKAQYIVTVSRYSRNQIKNFLGFDSKVVYTSAAYLKKFVDENSCLKMNRRKYFFHIGGISPHKNTELCITAFLESGLKDYDLVISGMDKKNIFSKKFNKIENIKFTGWIKDQEIASYYKYAEAVVFPSLQEGYGLPIVEAFNFNVPVITSNIPPMNEIAGEAAILIDPKNKTELLKAMKQITNPQIRKIILNKEKKQKKLFDSNLMYKKMMVIYRG